MKISSIVIEIELEGHDDPEHAEQIYFKSGMWGADGLMYSRLGPALHEVWKILRTAIKGDNTPPKGDR